MKNDGSTGFGIASIIFGILSITFETKMLYIVALPLGGTLIIITINFILGILAIVFGFTQNARQKTPLATTGIVTGIVGALFSLVFFLWALLSQVIAF